MVVADDENLDTAHDLGMWGVERSNEQLGRKFNDAYELSVHLGADYVIPIGSDDWLDPQWILARPLPRDAIRCARRCAFVDERGERIGWFNTPHDGGVGIRVIPTWMLVPFGARPAVEDRRRGIDGTTLVGMRRKLRDLLKLEYHELHPAQIVDWKSGFPQINSFDSLQYVTDDPGDPFETLAGTYPTVALDEMRAVYAEAAR